MYKYVTGFEHITTMYSNQQIAIPTYTKSTKGRREIFFVSKEPTPRSDATAVNRAEMGSV